MTHPCARRREVSGAGDTITAAPSLLVVFVLQTSLVSERRQSDEGLSAGENNFTRNELCALMSEQVIQFVGTNGCETGGITDNMMIAAMANA